MTRKLTRVEWRSIGVGGAEVTNREIAEVIVNQPDGPKHIDASEWIDAIEAALDEAEKRGKQSMKHQHLWMKSTGDETFCSKCGLAWSEA